jgi:hypothetical protein
MFQKIINWISSLFKKKTPVNPLPFVAQPPHPVPSSPIQPAPVNPPDPTPVHSNTVHIQRTYQTRETIGILTAKRIDGQIFACKTLELPWLNNQHMISCIPAGTHVATMQPFHASHDYQLMNVPNRTGIFIHAGNYADGVEVDTEGCILLGEMFEDINGDGQLDITNTLQTVINFKAFFNGEDFTITIT